MMQASGCKTYFSADSVICLLRTLIYPRSMHENVADVTYSPATSYCIAHHSARQCEQCMAPSCSRTHRCISQKEYGMVRSLTIPSHDLDMVSSKWKL